ncbi:MAG: thiamine diphosphokinase [Kiritimatiellae bacterium]|nr:thiamine diphosphokinase [Kiritimatiellia bacterium]
MMPEKKPIYRTAGNFRKLLSYQKAEAIYDITVFFCLKFLSPGDRTIDQMIQAARSGKQNIAEGAAASSTNAETEIKLVNVAKASLIELRTDYEDYLRTSRQPQWADGSAELEAMRALGKEHNDSAFFMPLVQTRPPATIANMAIVLLRQIDYLLFRQLATLGEQYASGGDLHERLASVRESERKREFIGAPPTCPSCGIPMVVSVAEDGPLKGLPVWGCRNRERCNGARDYKSRKPLPAGTLKLGFPWLRAETASKDSKDIKDLKDPKDPKDLKDLKDPKDLKDLKDPKDLKDLKDPKDLKDLTIAILANGAMPRHPKPLQILSEASFLICCDGALAAARALGREPDFVVGDGDSIPPSDRESLGDRFIHVAEQDTSDLAKAFRFACSRASRPPASISIAILGATGLREDHTLGNIFRLVDFTAIVPNTVIYTDTGVFEAVRNERAFVAQPGDAVSIFVTIPGTSVSSKGLQWPLDGVSLDELWAGTLNRVAGDSFSIRTDGRPALVYRQYPRNIFHKPH